MEASATIALRVPTAVHSDLSSPLFFSFLLSLLLSSLFSVLSLSLSLSLSSFFSSVLLFFLALLSERGFFARDTRRSRDYIVKCWRRRFASTGKWKRCSLVAARFPRKSDPTNVSRGKLKFPRVLLIRSDIAGLSSLRRVKNGGAGKKRETRRTLGVRRGSRVKRFFSRCSRLDEDTLLINMIQFNINPSTEKDELK